MRNSLVRRIFIKFRLHFIREQRRRFDKGAGRINFQRAGEFTGSEVLESKMVIHVRQLVVTDVWIQLVRQQQLTSSSFSLVAFKLVVKKLKAGQMSFRNSRVECLRVIDFLFREFYPSR